MRKSRSRFPEKLEPNLPSVDRGADRGEDESMGDEGVDDPPPPPEPNRVRARGRTAASPARAATPEEKVMSPSEKRPDQGRDEPTRKPKPDRDASLPTPTSDAFDSEHLADPVKAALEDPVAHGHGLPPADEDEAPAEQGKGEPPGR